MGNTVVLRNAAGEFEEQFSWTIDQSADYFTVLSGHTCMEKVILYDRFV